LLALGNNLWLAWKEFDGTHIYIKERHSRDAGRHWTDERIVAQTDHAADHPVLIAHDGAVFLSWATRDQSYRLIPLEAT
jgi:hemin uptake protein HemP